LVTRAFFHAVLASVTGKLWTDKAVPFGNLFETARKESPSRYQPAMIIKTTE